MATKLTFAPLVLLIALPQIVNATLINRGRGLIYDTTLNVTWLQDANYAKTSGYDDDGRMTWDEAMAWVDGLVYQGYDDWRLPLVTPVSGGGIVPGEFNFSYSTNGSSDIGFGATGVGWQNVRGDIASEMGFMYYSNLGDLGRCTPDLSTSPADCIEQANAGLLNAGPFSINIAHQPPFVAGVYWSEIITNNGAITFTFDTGYQGAGSPSGNQLLSWAVRDGDVSVPEPGTFFVISSGLFGIFLVTRRKSVEISRI